MKTYSRIHFWPALLSLVCVMALLTASVRAADETVTEDGIITGVMNITFKTRTNLDTSNQLKSGSPAVGAQDQYNFQMTVAKTTQFNGDIFRQPKLYSSVLGRTKQEAKMAFNTYIAVLNPNDLKQKKDVGKWVGEVAVDPNSGAYKLGEGESPMRIVIDTIGRATGFTDKFGGRLVGKAEKKESLGSYTYKRLVGTKTVEITVKKSDPMRFDNIELAKGPAEVYPHAYVTGRLDYDYETGNWFTDGVRFKYNLNGKEYEDVVTGSIKWVEDPNRPTNGKGYYDFNLRFNEDKNKSASTESAAFANMNQEDAFFAVDNSIPCLTGKIEYVDTFISGGTTPSSSKVTYHLNANKLTKQQVLNFFKLWMVCVGPTNDE
jgi:lipoprotein-anchoring transpeptidase ErfK/SrfK